MTVWWIFLCNKCIFHIASVHGYAVGTFFFNFFFLQILWEWDKLLCFIILHYIECIHLKCGRTLLQFNLTILWYRTCDNVLTLESSTFYTVILLKQYWGVNRLTYYIKKNHIIPKLGLYSGVAGNITFSQLQGLILSLWVLWFLPTAHWLVDW